MTEASRTPAEPGDTVWIWQRNRAAGEMEKVLVPAAGLLPEWVAPLQRRYRAGDRVLYSIHDKDGWHPGTVVQDQGLYMAIDGDAPDKYATAPKTHAGLHAITDSVLGCDPRPPWEPGFGVRRGSRTLRGAGAAGSQPRRRCDPRPVLWPGAASAMSHASRGGGR